MLPSPLPFHDVITYVIHSSIDIFGTVANLYLLMAVIYRSPKSLGTYKIILANLVLIELFSCIGSLLVMIRLIPSGSVIGYVYLGPCTLTGSMFFCHLSYCIVLHTCAHSLYICLLSFAYRLYVLKHSVPTRCTISAICLAIYLPSLGALFSLLFTLSPPELALSAMAAVRPEYDLSQYDLTIHTDVRDPFIMFTILFMTLPAVPVMVATLALRRTVISCLDVSIAEMSARTLKMHHDMVKILTLQCLLPAFFLGGVVCFVLCTFNLLYNPYIEHAILGFLSIGPAISPVITISHVRPYRDFARTFWRRNSTASLELSAAPTPQQTKIEPKRSAAF